jgi:hypothetical protein
MKRNHISNAAFMTNNKAESGAFMVSDASTTGGWGDGQPTISGKLAPEIIQGWPANGGPPSPPPPTPTSSTPATSPTTIIIEAECYLWMLGVLTKNTSDGGGGKNVGYIDTGGWMSFPEVTILSTRAYRVEYRVTCGSSDGSLHLEKSGGTQVYGTLSIQNTGGWQNWQTVSHTVNLNVGPIVFGILAKGGGWIINWFHITMTSLPTRTEPTTHKPTSNPTTLKPTTTSKPTTRRPTLRLSRRPTNEATTHEPTTNEPSTVEPMTNEPTTSKPTTNDPTTNKPTTNEPTTSMPTTSKPTTRKPNSKPTTHKPTTISNSATLKPKSKPTTNKPTTKPTTHSPTSITPVSVALYWFGPIRLINKIPKTKECIFMDKPVNYFGPGNRQGLLYENQQVNLGPFSGWYTLGVQENTFGACSYIGAPGHQCLYDNSHDDNFCFNFNVDGNCKVKKKYALNLPLAIDTCILQLQMGQQGIRSMVSSKVECVN